MSAAGAAGPVRLAQPATRASRRGERGVVLALVLVMVVLLMTTVAVLGRRSVVDHQIALNRDQAGRALALARGGVRLATALLAADALAGGDGRADSREEPPPPGDTLLDEWARARHFEIAGPDGGSVRLRIRDAGARLNPNALIGGPGGRAPDEAVEFLVAFFEKVIDEMPIPPGEKVWDPRQLAHALLDWIDADETQQRGGAEDDYYQQQDPPYRAANRPLLTVEELNLVEGFTPDLVDALRPYLTVHPGAGASGIDLNTAPPWVLAAVYHGSQGSRRLADEDTVRRILRVRQEGRILCDSSPDDRCILTNEIVDGSIYPSVSLPVKADVFTVEAEATVGEIQRSVEAVIDRSNPAAPRLIALRTL